MKKEDTLLVTHECLCGGRLFQIYATFDDYEISGYHLIMTCAECGREYLAPTPLDRPENV